MKSIKFLVLLTALLVGLASAGDKYKAFNIETDYGTFTALSSGDQVCDNLKIVFHTNKKIREAAKSKGSLEIEEAQLGSALQTSMTLKEFQQTTGLDISSSAKQTTECKQSRRHRLRLSKKVKKNKAKILDSVYISTFSNKYLVPKEKVDNSEDEGQNQYFDTAPQVKEYSWNPKNSKTDRPSVDKIISNLGLERANLKIKAAKLYYRLSGSIARQVILDGNKRFKGDLLYKETPTVLEAAYWFKWKPSKVKDPADIHHEFIEICLEDGSRLVVDRGSRESPPDVFNTRVRFIKLDTNGGDCSTSSNNWLDKELLDKQYTDKV